MNRARILLSSSPPGHLGSTTETQRHRDTEKTDVFPFLTPPISAKPEIRYTLEGRFKDLAAGALSVRP
jgi:hypothetical protein